MKRNLLVILLALAVGAMGQNPCPAPQDPDATTRPTPKVFLAKFETSAGKFTLEVHRDWAPNGADRVFQLVCAGFFDESRFFRVVPRFVVQFGIAGDPKIEKFWYNSTFPDDPTKESNRRGFASFAMTGPGTRTTQLFISLADNTRLDSQGFVPFARVSEGMDVVDKLYDGYGENSGGGMRAGNQGKMMAQGNAYLDKEFPKLDKIIRVTVELSAETDAKPKKQKGK